MKTNKNTWILIFSIFIGCNQHTQQAQTVTQNLQDTVVIQDSSSSIYTMIAYLQTHTPPCDMQKNTQLFDYEETDGKDSLITYFHNVDSLLFLKNEWAKKSVLLYAHLQDCIPEPIKQMCDSVMTANKLSKEKIVISIHDQANSNSWDFQYLNGEIKQIKCAVFVE